MAKDNGHGTLSENFRNLVGLPERTSDKPLSDGPEVAELTSRVLQDGEDKKAAKKAASKKEPEGGSEKEPEDGSEKEPEDGSEKEPEDGAEKKPAKKAASKKEEKK